MNIRSIFRNVIFPNGFHSKRSFPRTVGAVAVDHGLNLWAVHKSERFFPYAIVPKVVLLQTAITPKKINWPCLPRKFITPKGHCSQRYIFGSFRIKILSGKSPFGMKPYLFFAWETTFCIKKKKQNKTKQTTKKPVRVMTMAHMEEQTDTYAFFWIWTKYKEEISNPTLWINYRLG